MSDFSKRESGQDEPLPQIIREKVTELGPEMEKIYSDFHENPELGGQEYETSKKVVEFLKTKGIEIVGEKIGGIFNPKTGEKPEGTGIVGIIRGKEGGPTLALRADMDALPIQENKSHSPCSKNDGVMHACGHDMHTTALMGAAEVLKGIADEGKLDGDVVLLFQPSEENAHQKESGAVQMVRFLEESGLRDQIKAFVGLHVFGSMERGAINVKDGSQLASTGELDITLKGPGGHVMNIFEQPDLQNILSRVNVELKKIFEPLYKDSKALVGSTRADYVGSSYNIIPAEAKTTWAIRLADPLYREISKGIIAQIKETVEKAVEEEAGKTSSKEKISVGIKNRPGYRPTIHRDPKLVALAETAAEEALPNYKGNTPKQLWGGEDFSFYLEKFKGKQIPGVFVIMGGINLEAGYEKVGQHTPDFKIDPGAMQDMASMFATLSVNAIKQLKQN